LFPSSVAPLLQLRCNLPLHTPTLSTSSLRVLNRLAARYHAAFRIALHCHYGLFRRRALPATSAPSSSRRAFEPIPCGFSSPVPVAAAFASLLYAFSPLVWFYSIQAEVFALNNAFVAVRLTYSSTLARLRQAPIILMSAGAAVVLSHVLGASQRDDCSVGRIFHWPWTDQPAHARVLCRPSRHLGNVPATFSSASGSVSQNVRCWACRPAALCISPPRVHAHAGSNMGRSKLISR
jgi:hypothetical protein